MREAVESYTAKRRGIDNTPGDYELTNMIALAENIFEPLREYVGGPIKINSMYRSEALNKAIGGSSRSQQCQGNAMDLDDIYGHKTNKEMFEFIREKLDFDQLIYEFGNEENPDWVHVSYVDKEKNRNRVLKAVRDKGKTVYIDITNK